MADEVISKDTLAEMNIPASIQDATELRQLDRNVYEVSIERNFCVGTGEFIATLTSFPREKL